jgi:O-antigen/teichoic acid export membrane protein
MRQSTRLIVNSISTFARMALAVVIGLLATRLLVQYLGKVDFGLVLALGATGGLLQFITSSLTSSVQRQLAYEIGRGDAEALKRVFSTSWLVYMALGVLVWLIGVALTPVIMRVLTIPAERADAAWWVYQISLLNVLLAITATPYQSLIVAHQHLTVSAVADSMIALARLAAVLLLLVAPWDLMVSFVAFQLALYAVVRWSVNCYCLWRYEESWPRPRYFDRSQLKQISGLASWTLLTQLSLRVREQGGILLLNVFFGPMVNAAYGVAVQLSDYALNIAQTLRVSVLPAIVGAHAKGHHQNVHRLALVAGKYSVLIASLMLVPIWLEAEEILHLWLGDVPAHSVMFMRLITVWTLLSVFTLGYRLANLAGGDLGWFTVQNLSVTAGGLLLAGIGFYFGMPPWFLPVTTVLGTLVLLLICVFDIGGRIGLLPSRWLYESLLPTLGVLAPGMAASAVVHWGMPPGVWRVLAVTATYALLAAPLIWWVALAEWERRQFWNFATAALSRLRPTADAGVERQADLE